MGLLKSFATKIVGGSVVETAEGLANVVDQFIETPDERRAWEQIQLRIAQQPQLAQIELNKIGAGHRTIFVAGWRPFIGWVCGLGLLNTFIINPYIQWVSCMMDTGCMSGPTLPNDIILELVLGLLGLGALRTFEKYTGKAQ